jgi:hypothetical protein
MVTGLLAHTRCLTQSTVHYEYTAMRNMLSVYTVHGASPCD